MEHGDSIHNTDIPEASLSDSPIDNQVKRVGFLLLNCWLVFHLFSIIICPASAEPSSPLLQSTFRCISPYLHALYLDHGFHYFAPEPGPSTLVAYSLQFPDGSVKTGKLPTRKISPRLFYHRHFMLTEFLANGPEELQPLVERALARNLCRASGAISATLTSVTHEPVTIEAFRKGTGLNDSSTFTETLLGTYTIEELKLPFKSKTNPTTDSPRDMVDPDTDLLEMPEGSP